MSWIKQSLDTEDRRDDKLARHATRIKEAKAAIWNKLAAEVRRELDDLKILRPDRADGGSVSVSSQKWRIIRLDKPPYEVEVELCDYSIQITHEFKSRPISPGERALTVVDMCCDEDEQVCLVIDGKPVGLAQLSQRILEPIVTGRRPR